MSRQTTLHIAQEAREDGKHTITLGLERPDRPKQFNAVFNATRQLLLQPEPSGGRLDFISSMRATHQQPNGIDRWFLVQLKEIELLEAGLAGARN